METELILVDTNIIIEVFRKNVAIIKKIKAIGVERIAVSSVTVMELYFGALNKVELNRIKRYLKAFTIVQIDESISLQAVELVERFGKSHGLNLPDALIAATSIIQGQKLLTLNKKDFKYIDGVELY